MEQVTVIPQSQINDDGDPVAGGDPFVLSAFAVAPGNTTVQYNNSGDVESADFTVYLDRGAPVLDGDVIQVRGLVCVARVQEWRDPWPGEPLEGLVVLCRSKTGASNG